MRHLIIIFAIGLFVALSACAPVAPAGSGDSAPEVPEEATGAPTQVPETPADTEEPAPQEDDPTVTDDGKRQLPWNTDPEALIVSATFCCGFVPQLAVTNYIPDAQVWGDGRVVWVEQDDDGSRRVIEGSLDLGELELVLNQIRDAGFYKWDEYYANQQVADFADKCIRVNLIEEERSVCEYYEGAPEAFHKLYEFLNDGAGASDEHDFVPETGFLTVIPLGGDSQVAEADLALEWEPSEYGFSLSEVGKGIWIKGPGLQAAWEAVNFRPWNPIIREAGSDYMIGLQVPNLSLDAPSE